MATQLRSEHIDIPPEQPAAEADVFARYEEHLADCEGCDPSAGRLCRVGAIRRRRWLAAQERAREASA